MVRDAQQFVRGRHLYSYVNPDGSKDSSLEQWFSQLEGTAAPILRKIVANARQAKRPSLTAAEKEIWDAFLYQQWRRVPDLYASLLAPEAHKAEVEHLLDELSTLGRPVSNWERSQLLEPVSLKRMRQNVRVSSLTTGSEMVLSALGRRGLAVAKLANPRKSFILGSRPVVKCTLPGITDLSDPRVELWLPISYDVMAGIGRLDEREILVPLNDQQVRLQNEAAAAQSTQIVGRSRELVQSLSRFVGTKAIFSPMEATSGAPDFSGEAV
ncbi:DUF4238 domain-containing protein [Rhizobium laguerreae]|uniref:DUF4238 domain-containing protein n=1 Tax=Rhizobium laguerreae TaxID=1076926 RepID=UPI00144241F0|nr:DUF4238 domain-containing protein [Rhizobium laguerreae]NKM69410.1 DUF4238 domain-containing protein [Rhizobium laguerreae]